MSQDYMSKATLRLKRVAAPLRKAEQRRAVKAVVRSLAEPAGEEGLRHRVLWAEVRIDKPAKPRALPARLVSVAVVDYGHRQNLEFLLDGGRVVQRRELPYQPPFHREEVEEAVDIAQRDERVRRVLKKGGAFDSVFSPEAETATSGRLVGLRYAVSRKRRAFEPLARVVVNLSEGSVGAFYESSTEGGR